jgi:hypothetical protein
MKFYFCERRSDWYLGSGDEIAEVSMETLQRWAKLYPAGRRYYATDEERLRRAKGNTAREMLRLHRSQRQYFENSDCYLSSVG